MKRPLISECPCCDSILTPSNVRPIAFNKTLNDVRSHVLKWQCAMCGAEWEHGQYEEKEGAE